jgi:hypothetical protein
MATRLPRLNTEMERPLLAACFLAVAATCMGTTVGCSDGDTRYASLPAAGGSGVVPQPLPPSQAGTDRGAPHPETSSACATVAPEGETIRGSVVAGRAPSPSAGELVPGTYVLVNIDVYPGYQRPPNDEPASAPPPYITRIGKKTLVITDRTFVFEEADGDMSTGLSPATHTEGTYSLDDTDIVFSRACPDAATVRIPYSASGGVVALHRADAIEVYQRQP